MKHLLPLQCLAAVLIPAIVGGQQPGEPGKFQKIKLSDEFWAEGATFGDFNKDGKQDVASGPYWWAGPDFQKRHTYYPDTKRSKIKAADGAEKEIPGFKGALSNENDYSDNFIAYTDDFNGDGWDDILVIGFPGKEAFWYANPQGKDQPWARHVAWDVVDNESPMYVDLTGDGKREIVCSSGGFMGYAEPDRQNPTSKWTWRPISPKGGWQRFTHGIGVGDVNGDGRMDLLEATGWWEQPATLGDNTLWTKHDALFGKGGAQMYAYDVNGDGKNDVITSLEAHGYGLVWFEQTNEGGAQGWTKHVIVGSKPEENAQGVLFSQPHAIDLVDMNGDGLKDIVSGKRYWAHGPKGDAEPNAAAVLYWFELKRENGKASYVAHLIDADSGVGTQVMAGDISGDGKPDVVVGNKKGVFAFVRK
jgi:hypothetical protein